MLTVKLTQIGLKSCLGVCNALQIGIPVVDVRKAAENDPGLMPVERANALHLIQKESLVELNDPVFQLKLNRLEALLPDHDVVLA